MSPRWCPAWGHPVNQEDLLGTLLTFSLCVLHALDRLGIPYDPDAGESYMHVWCVVGQILGIDPGLLPLTRREAEDLATTIFRRQHAPSAAGRRLMTVLLTEMELSMPWGLRNVPRTLVRRLVPPDVADDLAVPGASWWRPVLGTMRVTAPVARRVPGMPPGVRGPGHAAGALDDADVRGPLPQRGPPAVPPRPVGRRRRWPSTPPSPAAGGGSAAGRGRRHARRGRGHPGDALLTGRRSVPHLR